MRSRWITHKGTTIFYCDYSGLGDDLEALRGENAAVATELTRQPAGSVLELVDVRGSIASREAVALLKASASRTRPYIRKTAVVGVEGVVKVLAQAVSRVSGMGLTLFATEEQAKDWLVAAR